MKYFILVLTIACISSICYGFLGNSEFSEKFIGFGVAGLFLIVIPLFSYHRWKNKSMKDYLLTKENLDKMRDKNT